MPGPRGARGWHARGPGAWEAEGEAEGEGAPEARSAVALGERWGAPPWEWVGREEEAAEAEAEGGAAEVPPRARRSIVSGRPSRRR